MLAKASLFGVGNTHNCIHAQDTLRQLGAELIEIPAVPYKNPNNYVHVAARLAEALGDGVVYANQWDNLANRQVENVGSPFALIPLLFLPFYPSFDLLLHVV